MLLLFSLLLCYLLHKSFKNSENGDPAGFFHRPTQALSLPKKIRDVREVFAPVPACRLCDDLNRRALALFRDARKRADKQAQGIGFQRLIGLKREILVSCRADDDRSALPEWIEDIIIFDAIDLAFRIEALDDFFHRFGEALWHGDIKENFRARFGNRQFKRKDRLAVKELVPRRVMNIAETPIELFHNRDFFASPVN